ncbi:MAG: ATP-grasp domain-containing protein [Xanthomonadaceae bacterium]|nr:ATP-grasp domain-containing protein [Xanthomonadaceae bacterium]MDE1885924.1 ATP-grasp domain-containing protein [Xanthomonadaceae bacterium]MDE1961287.1 ATP-grasp domain-containing protein [Xanthomonadaceae bacterium]MDE2084052.1 ATP-grasp domain-containing protein [Xanthomonadaceae bacterium]MDE2257565.1 ATP-grasp domain-containing protein [Xanthomonadaceae bacterium]
MRVLMIALAPRWLGPARLLCALCDRGAEVATFTATGSLVEKVRRVAWRFTTPEAPTAGDLLDAVAAFAPDRLLPADELSVRWLHAVHADAMATPSLRALIAVSIGDPAVFHCTTDKLAVAERAAALGVAQPATARLADTAAAFDFVHANGWPVVVKACAGYAGISVFVCETLRDLRRALRECEGGERRLIQRYESGVTWMGNFVAARGRMLALATAEKVHKHPDDTGPSTVLRFATDVAMRSACERIVRDLGYSGFGSADFQKTRDDRTLFLEFNPRPTPSSHLGARLGIDLVGAFLDGQSRLDAAQRSETIALYPQELLRDPSGAGIDGHWLDVPHGEPELRAAFERMVADAKAAANQRLA